jgi:hypothetical protein
VQAPHRAKRKSRPSKSSFAGPEETQNYEFVAMPISLTGQAVVVRGPDPHAGSRLSARPGFVTAEVGRLRPVCTCLRRTRDSRLGIAPSA